MEARRWVHAVAGVRRVRRRRTGRARQEGMRPRDRGERGVRRSWASARSSRRSPALESAKSCSPAARRRGSSGRRSSPTCSGCPVRVPASRSRRALGAAIYAGVGVGLYADAAGAGRARAFERTFDPSSAAAAYDELYDQWRELYGGVARAVRDRARAPAVARRRHLTRGAEMPEADVSRRKGFHAEIPPPATGFFLQGRRLLRLGDEEPARTDLLPRDGRTVMLAFDHGYFQGPDDRPGADRPRIAPLAP